MRSVHEYMKRGFWKSVGLALLLGFCYFLLFFGPPGSSYWKPTGWTLVRGVLVSGVIVFGWRLLCGIGLMISEQRRRREL